VIGVTRQSVFGLAVGPESSLPDIAFYVLGALIGAGAGVLQSASRTMMVRQSPPDRMAESFGLFALTGKATSFLAPLSIAVVTDLSDSQRIGVMPLIVMFLIGLVLLWWVKPNGEQAAP
jgi:MFS transporter, UMF1 family